MEDLSGYAAGSRKYRLAAATPKSPHSRYPVKRLSAAYAIAKRTLDVLLASLLSLLASPLLVVIAVLVRVTSPGPAIFRQTRVGLGGRAFTCLKFRTMYDGAEDHLGEVAALNEVSGPVFKIRRDPRITPLGRILRRSSLDELPQLFNVLCGEMSFVGPRPPLLREVSLYGRREIRRLEVKPGLTCLWQISGRSEIGFDRWVELDLEYIDQMSFWTDLAIILKTVPAVLSARGAY